MLPISPFDDLSGLCLEIFPFLSLESYDSGEHPFLDIISPLLLYDLIGFPHEPLYLHQFILFLQNSVIGFLNHIRSFDHPTECVVFGAL